MHTHIVLSKSLIYRISCEFLPHAGQITQLNNSSLFWFPFIWNSVYKRWQCHQTYRFVMHIKRLSAFIAIGSVIVIRTSKMDTELMAEKGPMFCPQMRWLEEEQFHIYRNNGLKKVYNCALAFLR